MGKITEYPKQLCFKNVNVRSTKDPHLTFSAILLKGQMICH